MFYIKILLITVLLSPILKFLLEITFCYRKICSDEFGTGLALYFLRMLIPIFYCSICTSLTLRHIKANLISRANWISSYSYSSVINSSIMQVMQSLTMKLELKLNLVQVELCKVAE